MVNLYRRHEPKCSKGPSCNCPIWAYGAVNGKQIRKSLRTRQMERAMVSVKLMDADEYLPPEPAEDRCLRLALAEVDTPPANPQGRMLYIMHHVGQEFVKIGVATDVESRRLQVQTSSPHPVVVLLSLPGGDELERVLHNIFAKYRHSGEWFHLVGAVARFVVHLHSRRMAATLPPPREPAPTETELMKASFAPSRLSFTGSGRFGVESKGETQ